MNRGNTGVPTYLVYNEVQVYYVRLTGVVSLLRLLLAAAVFCRCCTARVFWKSEGAWVGISKLVLFRMTHPHIYILHSHTRLHRVGTVHSGHT